MRKAQLCGPNLQNLKGCSSKLQLIATHMQTDLGKFYMWYMHVFGESLRYFETFNFHLTVQWLFINIKLQNNLGHFVVTRAKKRIFYRLFSKRPLTL